MRGLVTQLHSCEVQRLLDCIHLKLCSTMKRSTSIAINSRAWWFAAWNPRYSLGKIKQNQTLTTSPMHNKKIRSIQHLLSKIWNGRDDEVGEYSANVFEDDFLASHLVLKICTDMAAMPTCLLSWAGGNPHQGWCQVDWLPVFHLSYLSRCPLASR